MIFLDKLKRSPDNFPYHGRQRSCLAMYSLIATRSSQWDLSAAYLPRICPFSAAHIPQFCSSSQFANFSCIFEWQLQLVAAAARLLACWVRCGCWLDHSHNTCPLQNALNHSLKRHVQENQWNFQRKAAVRERIVFDVWYDLWLPTILPTWETVLFERQAFLSMMWS